MNIKTNLLLSKENSEKIKNFVRDNFSNDNYFIDNGHSRRYSSLTNTETPITELAKEIRKDSFSMLGIETFEEEPIYGIFLGVNTSGGSVHEHTDPTIEGHDHFRLNYMVSKPDFGGMPVIDGVPYSIKNLESWINIASDWKHRSTPVIGNNPRIVLSLGAYVKKETVQSVFNSLN